jgi:hypothetical protein
MLPQLTEIQKVAIIVKLEEGWSIRRLTTHLDLNASTVARLKKRWEQDGTLRRKVGSGGRKISNNAQDVALVNFLRKHPFESAANAAYATNFLRSRPMACRRTKTSDLKDCASARKALLSNECKQSRVVFALNYVYGDPDFWKRIVFTDEKTFKSGNDGRIRVYRPPNSRFEEQYVSGCNKSGRFSVNVWAWMGINGPGVWRIGARFNSETYLDILDNIMLPSVNQIYDENNFIYQQDNIVLSTPPAQFNNGWNGTILRLYHDRRIVLI